MAIQETCTWWFGTEPNDIEDYLKSYTSDDGMYPINAFRLIRCECGSDHFLATRARDIVERTCVDCAHSHYICHSKEDWEEAIEEEKPEKSKCIECTSEKVNIGVGFAGYPENPELVDAVKWYYVGVRCTECGVLGCLTDGKVGRIPAKDVYEEA